MTDRPHARITKLKELKHCPVCGAASRRCIADDNGAMALYTCGSIFEIKNRGPILCTLPCPKPSDVAAAVLNDEVAIACRDALKAGAL